MRKKADKKLRYACILAEFCLPFSIGREPVSEKNVSFSRLHCGKKGIYKFNHIGVHNMKCKRAKVFILSGIVSCLLAGCGNEIPALTEEEASLIAVYAADMLLENSRESASRLMDTEAETTRRKELAEKVENLRQKQTAEEEEEKKTSEAGKGKSPAGSAAVSAGTESIAGFIGLDGFQVSYDGYEIKNSYQADEEEELAMVFDASSGKNLLIVKLSVTNISDSPAVADVLSQDMLFSINDGAGINSMALMTMLLNDFAYAQDEIGAGESRQYVLITEIDKNITEAGSLTLQMKKGDERMNVTLQ